MSDQDKINIYVPREVGELLDRDIEMFEVFKPDGVTLNRNQFLTQLIVGYYDAYARELQDKYEAIMRELSPIQTDRKTREQIASNILDQLSLPKTSKRVGRTAEHFSLKPTNKTESLIQKIRGEIEKTDYVSRYLARMLMSYSEKPFSQRERIVFKDNYDMLAACCKKLQPVYFCTAGKKSIIHEVIPYMIVTGPEELYNYLLCQEENERTHQPEARAYRLNRIQGLKRSVKTVPFHDSVKQQLEVMRKQGPQYAINDDTEVCVRLTSKGRDMYKKIYFGRPAYIREEIQPDGCYQYYRCSHNQLVLYFRRFGAEAEIVSPETLRNSMAEFFHSAAEVYNEQIEGVHSSSSK